MIITCDDTWASDPCQPPFCHALPLDFPIRAFTTFVCHIHHKISWFLELLAYALLLSTLSCNSRTACIFLPPTLYVFYRGNIYVTYNSLAYREPEKVPLFLKSNDALEPPSPTSSPVQAISNLGSNLGLQVLQVCFLSPYVFIFM